MRDAWVAGLFDGFALGCLTTMLGALVGALIVRTWRRSES